MPTVFEITIPQNNIRLDANRAGTASFTLTNISGRSLRGRITITADQADAQSWLSISGDSERNYNVGAVDQVDIKIAPPASAVPGSYSFSISAADTNLPDDTRTQGPSVSFELLPIPIEQPKLNPLLIIIPILVVLAIVIVLVIAFSNPALTDAERTQTVIAAELTAELTANAARTQTAIVLDQTAAVQTSAAQTLSAAATLTAQAALQTAAARTAAAQTAAAQTAAAQTSAARTAAAQTAAAQTAAAQTAAVQTQIAAATQTAVAALNAPRRVWTNDKTYSCLAYGSGVAVTISNQNVEGFNLPAGAQYRPHYIVNGVDNTNGPYPVEGNGRTIYASFLQPAASYPFTFEYRLDTIVNGTIVYQSSLTIRCTGHTSGQPITPVSVPAFRGRVWVNDKTYTCGPYGSGVSVTISNQNVQGFNLPAGAQYRPHYIVNGVDNTNGPFPVEGNGWTNYAAFLQPAASYPFTFEYRLDTIINGVVVYQSSLNLTCTGNVGSLPVVPYNR